MLDLQEVKEEMKNEVGINFSSGDVESFQSRVTELFYIKLKENRFTSQDLVSCFSIFDPMKVSEISTYREDKIKSTPLNTMGWSIQLSQFLEMNL